MYYGMETGDDATLKAVNKGVDGEQAIEAGRRVTASGMKLSMMIILGLAGAEAANATHWQLLRRLILSSRRI